MKFDESDAIRTLRAAHRRVHEKLRNRMSIQLCDRQYTEPAVYFVAPTITRPHAGARVIYRHIDLLHAAGIPAMALHQKAGYRYTFFENHTPVVYAESALIGPRDLLVVPEVDVDILVRHGSYPRHVVLNQNGYFTWQNYPEPVNGHYASSRRPMAIIATSSHIAEFVRFAFPDIEVRRVNLSIDTDKFSPNNVERPRRIVYMPRRGADDATMALRMLRNRESLRGWDIRPLDNLREAEVARELRNARIFLAVSPREGLGYPPLEAMASGCYVVGYDAIGGREFMSPQFTSPVGNGDVLGLAQALESAVIADSLQEGWLRTRGLQAAEYVRNSYSADKERTDVLATYSDLLVPRNGASQ